MNNSHLDQDFFTTHIFTSCMIELEHLDETHQEATDWIGTRQWNMGLWVQQNHKIKTFSMGDTFLWFPKTLVSKGLKGTHLKVQKIVVWLV
jgi:hypothetical protein